MTSGAIHFLILIITVSACRYIPKKKLKVGTEMQKATGHIAHFAILTKKI